MLPFSRMHCKYTWCTLARSLISLTSVIALTPKRTSCRNTRGHILARGHTDLISLRYKWGGTLGRSLSDARVISQSILYHRRHISNRGLLGLFFNIELARLVYLCLWVNFPRPHTMCKASHFLLEDPNESSLGEIIAKGQVPSAKKGAKVLLQYSINSTHFPELLKIVCRRANATILAEKVYIIWEISNYLSRVGALNRSRTMIRELAQGAENRPKY